MLLKMRKKRIPTCTTHHQLCSYTAYAVYNYVICKCLILCLVIFTILIQPITVNAKNIKTPNQQKSVLGQIRPSMMYNPIIPLNGTDARLFAASQRQDSVDQNSINSGNVNESDFNEENTKWLEDFIIITEDELKEKMKTKDVLSAAANSTSGNLYAVIGEINKDGEKKNLEYLKVEEVSQDLIIYLKVCGVDIKALAFDEKTISKDNKKSNNYTGSIVFFLIVLSICAIPYYKYRRDKKMVKVGGGDASKKGDVEIPDVRFNDVEGIEELKADITRLVDCLKNPKKYESIGARPPKGVILYGPPGTGKTLIAKAIAGEAGVPFFSAAGSDFCEMYVGVGAKRVRELYKKARKAAPCIVFIDEIDAVASQRGNDTNSERDQTINALLAELDGFNSSKNIITICATNRLDMLDSAFKRAGRFDLKLAVGLPDKKGRTRILEIHSRDKKLSKEIDLEVIANKTSGFSGAELEALLNESALCAVGKNKEEIDYEDIDDAFFKIVMQGNKKKREKITEMNKIVAWHEAGHTLVTKLLTEDSVSSVTIIGSSSGAGGVTFRTPKDDNMLQSKKYLEDNIKIMYGGRAAEEIYFKDPNSITTGASQDIKQATSIIKDYLSLYGMGDKGMLDLSQFEREFKNVIDEASILSKKLYEETVNLLKENYSLLKTLAETLLKEETLDEMQINKIINKTYSKYN